MAVGKDSLLVLAAVGSAIAAIASAISAYLNYSLQYSSDIDRIRFAGTLIKEGGATNLEIFQISGDKVVPQQGWISGTHLNIHDGDTELPTRSITLQAFYDPTAAVTTFLIPKIEAKVCSMAKDIADCQISDFELRILLKIPSTDNIRELDYLGNRE